jgi:hypothetical protein
LCGSSTSSAAKRKVFRPVRIFSRIFTETGPSFDRPVSLAAEQEIARGIAGAERTLRCLENVEHWTPNGDDLSAGPWVAHVAGLARAVISADRLGAVQHAAILALAALLGRTDAARDIVTQGFAALTTMPSGARQATIDLLFRSGGQPCTSPWIEENAAALSPTLGRVLAQGPLGWDVRSSATT